MAACATELPSKGEDAPFEVMEAGKADGSDMLSAADKERVTNAFDAVITKGEATIASLESEIASLDASNAAKQREADALVARIAAREQELKDNYNRNILLCAFFPNPVTCIFANYLANDSTLRSYHQQLDAARAEQQRLASKIAANRAERDALNTKLVGVRASRVRMVALFRDGVTSEVPPALADAAAAGAAYQRADAMGKVETAIAREIDVLVDIRNVAVELAQVLDQSLNTLRTLEHNVDDLVTKQREKFMDLLFDLLSGDPAAAADKWLDDVLAQKTRQMIDALGFPANELVRYLVESKGDLDDPAAIDDLVKRLLDKIVGQQSQPPLVVSANTKVTIHDKTTAKSPLTVSSTRAFTHAEVFVDIQHTYVGDLVVTLVHGADRFTLSNRVGGSADDMVKTFQLPALQGSANGTWTLEVADQEDQDEGTLRRWQLVLH